MISEQTVFQSVQDKEWINHTRTLVVASRGITAHQRQLILSLFSLMPHAKKDVKVQKHNIKQQILELCELHSTRYFMYFEAKRKTDLRLWIGKYPQGPSVKLKIEGIVRTKDVKFQGNSVKGARHILSFDHAMDQSPKTKVLKELLIGSFNIPKLHPKSTAVIDHTLNFLVQGDQICFKNYQIFRQDINKDQQKIDLYQIGPRFIMKIQCILQDVMGGEVLYRGPIMKKILKKSKYDQRKQKIISQISNVNIFGQQQ